MKDETTKKPKTITIACMDCGIGFEIVAHDRAAVGERRCPKCSKPPPRERDFRPAPSFFRGE